MLASFWLEVIQEFFATLQQVPWAHHLALHEVPPSDHLTLHFQKRVKLVELLLIPIVVIWIS
jgi:hypothetical protein